MPSEPARAKHELFAQFARIGKALASPARLQLLEALSQAPRTVEALAKAAALNVANASQHLKVLRQAGLVAASKDGLYVTYRLADDDVERLFVTMRTVATAQLAEVERARQAYLQAPEDLERIDASELRTRMNDEAVTLIDVRPPEEFAAGHLPGAVSVPLDALDERIDALPSDREVVAYCRGPFCVYAVQAVERLSERGLSARLYEDGLPGWRQAGLPVEEGA